MRLFRSKDVDGSGTLDMQEFVELVAESDMLNQIKQESKVRVQNITADGNLKVTQP